MKFAYADPPYPGLSRRYYEGEPTYAGEVDHVALIARLTSGEFDGWALSTSERALRTLLPLCPPEARLCPWVKPHGVSGKTRGLHNAWEAVIVVPGRAQPPGVRDWLRAMPARGGGELMGRKPLAFCATLFRWLGMLPGDALVDLFPGTGIVGRAWELLSSEGGDVSRVDDSDASHAAEGDALLVAEEGEKERRKEDASREAQSDMSLMESGSASRASTRWAACWGRTLGRSRRP